MSAPRLFRLVREADVSGVSGTGHIADGVLWPDGSATVRWLGDWPTTQDHPRGIASVEHIHGHGGATRIEWVDQDVHTGWRRVMCRMQRAGNTAKAKRATRRRERRELAVEARRATSDG